MEKNVKLVKQTTTDLVYEQLKKDIIDQVYEPGEKLSEAKIAERYGVSRDPVRKAVVLLEQESLLTSKPQFGTIVNPISLKQGLEVCKIRYLLETYAVEVAASKIDDEIVKDLKTKIATVEARLEICDREQVLPLLFEMDKELHNAIYDACGNEILKSIINTYSTIIQRIRKANVTWAHREKSSIKEMKAIIEALCCHDPIMAKEAMATHIANIEKTVEEINQEKKETEK